MAAAGSSLKPQASSLPGLFITGTGTEVGKTHVAAMIVRSLADAGRRVGVYKPVASGCRDSHGERIADDAAELWDAAGRPGELERVCPQQFLAAVAPPRAAAAEGRSVDRSLLRSGVEYWRANSEFVIVEGAGGLMSPLSETDYNLDVAADLGFPLLIVAANELGVINATMLTLTAARSKAPALPVAGVILNQATPRDGDASLPSNADELASRCEVPLLDALAYGQRAFSTVIDWFAVAAAAR